MKFQRHLRGGVLAATIAIAASLGATAPAQAQEGWQFCPLPELAIQPNCVPVPECVGSVCVSGLEENVEAIRATVDQTVTDLFNAIPEEVCTPPLPAVPVCVRT